MTNHLPTTIDGLTNVITGLGTAKSKRSGYMWEYGILNDWSQLDAMFQDNWIARQVVEVPAQDMTREWRRIKSAWAEDIEAEEQRLDLQGVVQDALNWARLYGGSGIIPITNQDLSKPLDITKIKKGELKRFLVFDRHDLTAMTMNTWDILAPNYLMPEFYNIRGGTAQIHWSHVAKFQGEKLPLRQMQLTQGWGDSTLRKCMSDINDTVAAKDGIAELMQEANIDVIKREGLASALASDQDDEIIKRYAMFSQMKSIVQMALLDESEELNRLTLNLSGVAPILDVFITWISGAARIPVTKLFGTSAKGLNATGEGDLRTYYDDIRAEQKSKLAKPLRMIDEILVRSATGEWRDDFDYEWNPLEQVNSVEVAQTQLLEAQRDAVYYESQIVQKSQVMRNLQSNEVYQFRDEDIDELEELENSNMFEELPPPELPDTFAPKGETATALENSDSYKVLIDAGLTHDEAVRALGGD